jgi:hypothetical protein
MRVASHKEETAGVCLYPNGEFLFHLIPKGLQY